MAEGLLAPDSLVELGSTSGSNTSDVADDSPRPTGSRLVDPDYHIPDGTLTETQYYLQHPELRTDRYGFVVQRPAQAGGAQGTASTSQSASAWDSQLHARRVRKWRRMLGPQGSRLEQYAAQKPAKFKRRVRKGIPEEFRGLAWHKMSGGAAVQARTPGLYALLRAQCDVEIDASIMRDLNRTFPQHVFFMPRQGPGQHALYNVLRAYAAYDTQVGYVQGMGFLASVLLLHMGEEAAFWTLAALMRGPRKATERAAALYTELSAKAALLSARSAAPALAVLGAGCSGLEAGSVQSVNPSPAASAPAALGVQSDGGGLPQGAGSLHGQGLASRLQQQGLGPPGQEAQGPLQGAPGPAAPSVPEENVRGQATQAPGQSICLTQGPSSRTLGAGGAGDGAAGSPSGQPPSSGGAAGWQGHTDIEPSGDLGREGQGVGAVAGTLGQAGGDAHPSQCGMQQPQHPQAGAAPGSSVQPPSGTHAVAVAVAVAGGQNAGRPAVWGAGAGPSHAHSTGSTTTTTTTTATTPSTPATPAHADGNLTSGPATAPGSHEASTSQAAASRKPPPAAGLAIGMARPHLPLAGMYTQGMPLLHRCLFQLQGLLSDELPGLAALFAREGVDVGMFSTHWFNTVFAYCLPFSHLLRLWDVFMLEGQKIVFRVALAVMRAAERPLAGGARVSGGGGRGRGRGRGRGGAGVGLEEVLEAMSARSVPALLPHPDELIKAALRIKVSKRLASLQQQWEQKHPALQEQLLAS